MGLQIPVPMMPYKQGANEKLQPKFAYGFGQGIH